MICTHFKGCIFYSKVVLHFLLINILIISIKIFFLWLAEDFFQKIIVSKRINNYKIIVLFYLFYFFIHSFIIKLFDFLCKEFIFFSIIYFFIISIINCFWDFYFYDSILLCYFFIFFICTLYFRFFFFNIFILRFYFWFFLSKYAYLLH